MTCRQVIEAMGDYLDGAAPADDRPQIESHLANCPHCSEFRLQIEAIILAARRVQPDTITNDERDELGAVYRGWLAS